MNNLSIHLTNIFTLDLRDWVCLSVSLSPPKPLDQSKNVTVRTFHIWSGLSMSTFFGQKLPKSAKKRQKTVFLISTVRKLSSYDEL